MVAACTCVLSLAFGGGKLWDACFVHSGEEGRGDAPFSPPPVSDILLSWEGDQIWENAVSGRSKNFFFWGGGEAEVVNKSHGIVGRRGERKRTLSPRFPTKIFFKQGRILGEPVVPVIWGYFNVFFLLPSLSFLQDLLLFLLFLLFVVIFDISELLSYHLNFLKANHKLRKVVCLFLLGKNLDTHV